MDELNSGRDVLFDIDWQGALQLQEKMRADVVAIFILPPSWEELRQRLLEIANKCPVHRALSQSILLDCALATS